MYDLVANNLNTNISKTSFIENNNKLVLFDTIFVNVQDLDIKLKDFIT